MQELNEGKHNECNTKTDRLNKSDGLDFSFIPKIQINVSGSESLPHLYLHLF